MAALDALSWFGGLAFLVCLAFSAVVLVVAILRSPTYDEAERYRDTEREQLERWERDL